MGKVNESYDKIALPVTYPLITSYPYHANLFSVFSDNEEGMIWFYNYYLQLSVIYSDTENNNILDFNTLDFSIGSSLVIPLLKMCPLIQYHNVSRSFIDKNYDSVVNFIIDTISEGFYLYFDVDQYEISAYKGSHKKHHIRHDLMVYGYDVKKSLFNIADFFDGKYQFATASFAEIEKGYIKCPVHLINGVITFKKSHNNQTNLNISKLKDIIDDYITSSNNVPLIDHDLLLDIPFDKCTLFGKTVHSYPV